MSKKPTFKELLNGNQPVMIDFFATWCGPCKALAPVLKNVKDSVGEDATIIKIDVDKNQKAAQVYQVRGVPTLILFKNGEIMWRKSGVTPENEIVEVVKDNV